MRVKRLLCLSGLVVIVLLFTACSTTALETSSDKLSVGLEGPRVFSSDQIRVTVKSVTNGGDIVGDDIEDFVSMKIPENKADTHYFLLLDVQVELLSGPVLSFAANSIKLMEGERELENAGWFCNYVGRSDMICGFVETSLQVNLKMPAVLVFIAPNSLDEFDLVIQHLEYFWAN